MQVARKIMEKEREVGNLKKKFKQQERKLQELKNQSQKEVSSSEYQYAYMHMQCRNEMGAYEMEQHISKLHAKNLQYKMQLARADSQKCALETEMQH